MSQDDFIHGMEQAVKKEVVQRYLRERRIMEEESNLVREEAQAFRLELAAWEELRDRLWVAFITPPAARELAELAGIPHPSQEPSLPAGAFTRPPGFTRCGRYRLLVEGLYRDLWQGAVELEERRRKALALLEEVNRDLAHFEATHDFLAIAAYLRSLDALELKRRKIMGVNFTAKECSLAAHGLCFAQLDPQELGLKRPPLELMEPERFMAAAREHLRRLCRRHPEKVERLWRPAATTGEERI